MSELLNDEAERLQTRETFLNFFKSSCQTHEVKPQRQNLRISL